MKKLMLAFAFVGVLFVGVDRVNENSTMNMRDIQKAYGMDYEVSTIGNTLFLIEYDEVTFAMKNNEKIGEVASVIESSEGIQVNFTDGSGYWIE